MRKLFRFKYEPCNGTCYAWCDVLPNELMKISEQKRQEIVGLMVKAHNNLCDNIDYSFGVDLDENTKMFVAHFRTPKSTDIFVGTTFSDCVRKVCDRVLSTEIPQVNGICTYGNSGSEDLGTEILRACTDLTFREQHHNECPCHANVAQIQKGIGMNKATCSHIETELERVRTSILSIYHNDSSTENDVLTLCESLDKLRKVVESLYEIVRDSKGTVF